MNEPARKKRPRAPRPPRAPGEAKPKKAPANRKRRPKLRWPASGRVTALFALGGLVLTSLVFSLVVWLGYGRIAGPGTIGAIEIDWPAGLDADVAGALLESRGVVADGEAMALYLRATGGTEGFVPGPHLLFDDLKPSAIRAMLERSTGRERVRVTFPEGFHRFDFAKRLQEKRIVGQKAFLAATTDRGLLAELGIEGAAEGYLFPATYDLPRDANAQAVVRRLVGESDKRWKALASTHADALIELEKTLGWSRREIVTLASMVEKEAQVDEERPLIASVFLNRLRDPDFKPKRLQSDPTSAYGCVVSPSEAPSCEGFAGKPTPAINSDAKNRYSTYVRAGLPPGPIANPGQRSIEAVLAPAETRFFFFVASGKGRHTFSESLDAHNQAVRARRAEAP